MDLQPAIDSLYDRPRQPQSLTAYTVALKRLRKEGMWNRIVNSNTVWK